MSGDDGVTAGVDCDDDIVDCTVPIFAVVSDLALRIGYLVVAKFDNFVGV